MTKVKRITQLTKFFIIFLVIKIILVIKKVIKEKIKNVMLPRAFTILATPQ